MNARIKKKLHKIIDLSFDAKDFGHDCFYRFYPHVNNFSFDVHKGGYIDKKKIDYRKDIYLDNANSEEQLNEIIEYVENLIDKS